MRNYSRLIGFYALTIAVTLLLVQWGSRAVTVLAQSAPIDRDWCIIIDPGHGGVDGGAVSCTGRPESGYNLEIALRLNDLFHLLGYDTQMIRTTDISVYTEGETIAAKKVSDLKERLRIVNEKENSLLLSIHQNNFPDGRYHGAQVFYGDTGFSKALASHLQAALKQTLAPDNVRPAEKSKGVYLMEHIQRPGVLIECGFLSNREEEARLRDGEYQKKLCAVIASAVVSFLSNT